MEIVYLKKSLPRENWIISFKEWKLSAGPQHFTVTWAVITMTVSPGIKVGQTRDYDNLTDDLEHWCNFLTGVWSQVVLFPTKS